MTAGNTHVTLKSVKYCEYFSKILLFPDFLAKIWGIQDWPGSG
ncbi:hypothetical protein TREAZ_2080 [Leadbettera azotonutricia ZAS-9]|uniref:Uncharacterized protein n=1 Tax=Leadbettera azotonutricia (strain ATCC BAA-888 / DSM 13862 / ZAS-9) TaxID=545695 RepID=F5Y9Y3_LEAAZ|nr:hypothetical protein TREAZ_2080 [Leadbettera azotonutricia ZAS-9]